MIGDRETELLMLQTEKLVRRIRSKEGKLQLGKIACRDARVRGFARSATSCR